MRLRLASSPVPAVDRRLTFQDTQDSFRVTCELVTFGRLLKSRPSFEQMSGTHRLACAQRTFAGPPERPSLFEIGNGPFVEAFSGEQLASLQRILEMRKPANRLLLVSRASAQASGLFEVAGSCIELGSLRELSGTVVPIRDSGVVTAQAKPEFGECSHSLH